MSSGTFVVRMPEGQHKSLRASAALNNLSLNELCIRRCLLPSALESLPEIEKKAVAAAVEVAGSDLQSIVVFGSWARCEAHALSDIDVLVVLGERKRITRDLYRQWEKLRPDDSLVEPHFVHLPSINSRVSGLWASVSQEGLVFADRNFAVQRYLAHVRRLIAQGQIVSKRIHGQDYWVHIEVA